MKIQGNSFNYRHGVNRSARIARNERAAGFVYGVLFCVAVGFVIVAASGAIMLIGG